MTTDQVPTMHHGPGPGFGGGVGGNGSSATVFPSLPPTAGSSGSSLSAASSFAASRVSGAAGVGGAGEFERWEHDLEYTYRWKVEPWSQLSPLAEYRSPVFRADALPWTLKVYKGRPRNPNVLSLYLGCDVPMNAVKKKIQITFMIGSPNDTRLAGYMRHERPVWFSSLHPTWGEETLLTLGQVAPLIKDDAIYVGVRFTILATVDDPEIVSPSPLDALFKSEAFADAFLHVSWDEREVPVVFPVLRSLLAAQSPYFAALFSSQFADASAAAHRGVRILHVDPVAFEYMLGWMYRQPSSTSILPSLTLPELEACLETAERFQVNAWAPVLMRAVRLHVTDHNVWQVWELARRFHCAATEMRAFAYIAGHFDRLCTLLVRESRASSSLLMFAGGAGAGGGENVVGSPARSPLIHHHHRVATGGSTSAHARPARSRHASVATSAGGGDFLHDPSSLASLQQAKEGIAGITLDLMRAILSADRLNVESEERVFDFFAEWVAARFEDGSAGARTRSTHPLAIPGTLVHETGGGAAGFGAAPASPWGPFPTATAGAQHGGVHSPVFPQPDLPSLDVDVEHAGLPTQHVPTELDAGGGGGETQDDAGAAAAGSPSALAAESALDAFLADDPMLDFEGPLRPPPHAQVAAPGSAAAATAQQPSAPTGQFPHDRLHSAPARTSAAGTGTGTGGSAAGSVGDSALGFGSTASSGFGGSTSGGGRFASTSGRGNTSPLTGTSAFTHHPPPPASLVSVATSPLRAPFDPLGSPRAGGASGGGWPLQWSQAATAEHQVAMTELVRLIRFPLMRKEYLSGTVERTQHVMAWPAMKDLLLAAYKYLLFPPADGAPGRVEGRGRLESPEFYI
ncbi:hypothetical protein H9P43_009259 [Blastocladiella emersonii ATCC 22665]|nr:hypothetical protein H9P43_009259 [Blastocladiella emersonii ATCC 22665]